MSEIKLHWTNTMYDHLRHNFGKVSPNQLMSDLHCNFKELQRHVKLAKIDRKGRDCFKLEEVQEMSKLLANGARIENLVNHYKDIQILTIYDQILALQEWSKLPSYERASEGNKGEWKWTDEELEAVKQAILNGVHHTEVHLPMRSRSAVQQRYTIMKNRMLEGERYAAQILNKQKGGGEIQLIPHLDRRRKAKTVERKRVKEVKKDAETLEPQEQSVLPQSMPERYYIFKGIQMLRDYASLPEAHAYIDVYKTQIQDSRYPLKILKGHLELIEEDKPERKHYDKRKENERNEENRG